jgi:hypothetical protein
VKREHLYDCKAGALASAARNPFAKELLMGECRKQCFLYDKSRDAVHLWRAWRIARAAGPLTAEFLELLTPRLDAAASALIAKSTLRADQRTTRNDALIRYYDLTGDTRAGRRKSKRAARDIIEREFGLKARSFKLKVMEHEGRGQPRKKTGANDPG